MSTPNDYFDEGNRLYASGMFEAAANAYKLGLRSSLLEPPEIHNNLGLALCQLGRHAEGLAEFQKALAWIPDDPEFLNNAGEALVELGRAGEAIVMLSRAQAIAPDDAEIRAALGRAYSRAGHFADAYAQFSRAAELDPENVEAAEVVRRMQMLSDELAASAGTPSVQQVAPNPRFTELRNKVIIESDAVIHRAPVLETVLEADERAFAAIQEQTTEWHKWLDQGSQNTVGRSLNSPIPSDVLKVILVIVIFLLILLFWYVHGRASEGESSGAGERIVHFSKAVDIVPSRAVDWMRRAV